MLTGYLWVPLAEILWMKLELMWAIICHFEQGQNTPHNSLKDYAMPVLYSYFIYISFALFFYLIYLFHLSCSKHIKYFGNDLQNVFI